MCESVIYAFAFHRKMCVLSDPVICGFAIRGLSVFVIYIMRPGSTFSALCFAYSQFVFFFSAFSRFFVDVFVLFFFRVFAVFRGRICVLLCFRVFSGILADFCGHFQFFMRFLIFAS